MTAIRLTAALAVLAFASTTAQAQGLLPWNYSPTYGTQQSYGAQQSQICGPNGCYAPGACGNTGSPTQYNRDPRMQAPPYTTNRPGRDGNFTGIPHPYGQNSGPYFNDSLRSELHNRPSQAFPNDNYYSAPNFQNNGFNHGNNQRPFQNQHDTAPNNRPLDLFNIQQNRQPLPGNPMFTGVSQPQVNRGWNLN